MYIFIHSWEIQNNFSMEKNMNLAELRTLGNQKGRRLYSNMFVILMPLMSQ